MLPFGEAWTGSLIHRRSDTLRADRRAAPSRLGKTEQNESSAPAQRRMSFVRAELYTTPTYLTTSEVLRLVARLILSRAPPTEVIRMRRLHPIDFLIATVRSAAWLLCYELTGESRTRSL